MVRIIGWNCININGHRTTIHALGKTLHHAGSLLQDQTGAAISTQRARRRTRRRWTLIMIINKYITYHLPTHPLPLISPSLLIINTKASLNSSFYWDCFINCLELVVCGDMECKNVQSMVEKLLRFLICSNLFFISCASLSFTDNPFNSNFL